MVSHPSEKCGVTNENRSGDAVHKAERMEEFASVFVFPPLSLAAIRSVTPPHHEVIVLDETLDELRIPIIPTWWGFHC